MSLGIFEANFKKREVTRIKSSGGGGILKSARTERKILASHIIISDTEDEMGRAAAENILKDIEETIKTRGQAVMLFASAPSQHSTWEHFIELWRKLPVKDQKYLAGRIIAFHMDEYLGLSSLAPQQFGNILRNKLFEEIGIPHENIFYFNDRLVNGMRTKQEALARADELTATFKEYGEVFDIVVGGIGKDGHLAFNSAPEARFDDQNIIKLVRISEESRQQQVDEGEFKALADVPTHALTFSPSTDPFGAPHTHDSAGRA